MVESRAEAALGLVAAGLEQIHVEPDRTAGRECAIEFVADPAPALDAEFADEPIRVQLDRFAEEDAGILERHDPEVRPMQGGQRLEVGAQRSCDTQAIAVGVEVDHANRRPPLRTSSSQPRSRPIVVAAP